MEERDPGRKAAFQAVQDMLDLWVLFLPVTLWPWTDKELLPRYFHIMRKMDYDVRPLCASIPIVVHTYHRDTTLSS